jgi:citrate synthase
VDESHQRRFDNQPINLLEARHAAALLGVKVRTLYAYASRGWLQSHPGEGRTRRYNRDEIERLKARRDARLGHGPVAAGALRWGEPVLESALTYIDPQVGPFYRGRPARGLARAGIPFEAVAELLWTGDLLEGRPGWPAAELPPRLQSLLPPGEPPLTALQVAVPALAARDAGRFDFFNEEDRARRLVANLAASVALSTGREAGRTEARMEAALSRKGVARALLAALGGPDRPAAVQAMDAALVLMADHELNTSAFAARVAASAGADLYACVAAALAALSGPRHGGACDRIEALLEETGWDPKRAQKVVSDRLRRGEAVPGFGHPLYPDGDPRTTLMMEWAKKLGGKRTRAVFALADALPEPSATELGLVALAAALELPRGAATAIFAVGRCAGWIAHALEQRAAGYLLRPRARYVGPRAPA